MPNTKQEIQINQTPLEQLSYEEALSELEDIVETLETEELTLEKSVNMFERGQSLVKFCTKLLDQTELKVQQVLGEELVDFES